MFELILGFAIIVALTMAFFYLRSGNSNEDVIETLLESLDKEVLNELTQPQVFCELEHSNGDPDQLLVYVIPKEEGAKPIGIIPYDFKPRILHFMNTSDCSYDAQFDRNTQKITIHLKEGLVT